MSTSRASKFAVQVTSDLTLASGWVPLKGINNLDPEVTPNNEDSSDYDNNGWASVEPTMQAWSLQSTFFRRVIANVYDPGQELIRARIGQFGDSARIGVQWYDKNGGPEANSGVAIPTWKRSNTAVKNLEQAQVTFTGTDVPLNLNIANPYQTALKPVVLTVTPASQGAGKSVAITGSAFTGATAVTFGGVAATSFAVINDQLITAVLPTGSAGSAPVAVTTPAGASTAAPYTRTT